jgi:hypothetical protein
MATSGAISSTMTAYEIAGAALRRAKVLREGQDPDATAFEEARRHLNRMLKVWTMDGANLWRDDEQTIDLVSGTATYELPTRAMRIRNVRLVESGVERLPLGAWGRDDYDMMPNKASPGRPSAYVVDRGRTGTTLILWPVPNDSTLDIKIGFERVIEDVTSAPEEIDAPQEWLDAVIDNLAVRLGDDETALDPRSLAPVRLAAAEGYARAQGHDRLGPVQFQAGGYQ